MSLALFTSYQVAISHRRTATKERKNNYMCTPCPAPTHKVKSLGEKKDFLSTDKAKHPNKLLINQRNDKILILGTAFAQKEFGLNIRKTYLRSQKVVTCCVSRGASLWFFCSCHMVTGKLVFSLL